MEVQQRVSRLPPGWPRLAAIWLAWWVVLVAAWLLLVDTLRADEVAVGLVAAAVSATLATVVHQRGYIRFWPRAAWGREAPWLLAAALSDCGLLAVALWQRAVLRRPVTGVTVRVPFDHGGDNGRDGARRALVNFAVSFTPNSYVVDIDPESDSLLVHQLVPAPLDRVLRREQQRAATATEPRGGQA
jgi:multisubunit Na+/H+ antiporter MnhE subunit